ncbi:hypothetical protein KM043_011262 [Ampulex compressa]|nr:hypothetical protein KM043_011262 [Ampulex compressa]
MATLRSLAGQIINLTNVAGLARQNGFGNIVHYSVYPPRYVKPVYKHNEQKALEGTEQEKILFHAPIKPATSNDTSSEFHDPVVRQFVNYLMRDGKKILARSLVEKAFENIKLIQLTNYNHSPSNQKGDIELNPAVLLHRAIANCMPILELQKVRKGGITYQVPSPITEKRSLFLSIKWLIQTASDKNKNKRFSKVLAKEIIDASYNQGRTVKKKQELHKQCEANRAYAHYRWE